MYEYTQYWNDRDHQQMVFGALRARNLAEEIVVGWTDQTDLFGFDVTLTSHALEYFGAAIHDGEVETHHDEFARDTIAQCSESLSIDMGRKEKYPLGHANAMLAARALKAFSGYLQSSLDEPPEAKAA